MSATKQAMIRSKYNTLADIKIIYSDKTAGPRALPRLLPSPPASRSLKMVWPRRVLALDIETTTCKKIPEKNEIAIVGVKVFSRRQGAYVASAYVAYRPSELKILERRLRRFRGLIVGHNIFDFDYRVLRRAISLEGVIEKTVDTLWLTRQRTKGRTSSLSLDRLARMNLHKGKLVSGKQIPVLWKQGKEKLVARHNERDCDITMRIWQHIVENGYLAAPDSQWGAEYLTFLDDDALVLGGQSPLITHERWLEAVDGGGKPFKRQPMPVRFVDDIDLQPDSFKAFNRVTCANCGKKFILVSSEKRVFRRNEFCACPHCAASAALKEVDTLWKAGAKKLVFLSGALPGEPGSLPSEEAARKWLAKTMRFGRWA